MPGMATFAPPRPSAPLRRTICTYTPEEFLAMEDGVAYEMFEDGTLQERDMSVKSESVAYAVGSELRQFVTPRQLGVVLGQSGLQIFKDRPRRIPRPDTGFISKGRLPGGAGDGHLQTVPELLVEVVSKRDEFEAVEAKIEEYLAAGVSVVWLVKPRSKTVDVWRADGSVTHLKGDDEITGDDFLPGFAVKVSAFFV